VGERVPDFQPQSRQNGPRIHHGAKGAMRFPALSRLVTHCKTQLVELQDK
jgi:hypothetical protein